MEELRIENEKLRNKMKQIIYLLIGLSLLFAASCAEEGRIDHIDGSAPAPAQITVTDVFSRPGGAVIKYKLPNDENMAGVKAVYERNGETCETKSSIYCDSLTLEGFGDTKSREVKIYSIGRNEKLSEPITRTIVPLTPPIVTVKFDMEPTFGGVKVKFSDNETRAALALVLMIDPINDGRWEQLHTFYTASEKGALARTEMNSQEYKIGMYVRDRWNNCSDTLVKLLTPFFLEKLPKDSWTNARLPGDTYRSESVADYQIQKLENLWDGLEYPTWYPPGCYVSDPGSPIPQHFTIKLGYTTLINRLQLWSRDTEGELYGGEFPRIFELWGTENPPADGSFDNWHLLGKYEVYKPSGYRADGSVGVVTSDDREYYRNAQIYEVEATEEFPDANIPVSYVRFRTVHIFSSYGTSVTKGQVMMSEMTLWGSRVEN
jgi:hypothetical protein